MFTGMQDFDPRFAGALKAWMAANPQIGIFSGYRSPARQAQLFAQSDQSGHWVARNSFHTKGEAADLTYQGQTIKPANFDAATIDMLHRQAGGFGLKFPMPWEAWHVEPSFTRGGGMAGGGALPSFVSPMGGVDYAGAAPAGGAATSPAPGVQDVFDWRNPASGLADVGSPGPGWSLQAPMTPMRFLEGMIAGQNPLRQMILGGIMRAIG